MNLRGTIIFEKPSYDGAYLEWPRPLRHTNTTIISQTRRSAPLSRAIQSTPKRRCPRITGTAAAGMITTDGMTTIRATGDRGHFYGYEHGRSVAHGHTATPPAGRAGLRIEGIGELRLRRIEVRAVGR
jgi:hypothetical protein